MVLLLVAFEIKFKLQDGEEDLFPQTYGSIHALSMLAKSRVATPSAVVDARFRSVHLASPNISLQKFGESMAQG